MLVRPVLPCWRKSLFKAVCLISCAGTCVLGIGFPLSVNRGCFGLGGRE